MTYHRVCNKRNTTWAINEAGTISEHLSRLSSIPGCQWGLCCSIFSLCIVFCRSSFVLLRIKDSDYPFGTFKLFLTEYCKASCHDMLPCLKSTPISIELHTFSMLTYVRLFVCLFFWDIVLSALRLIFSKFIQVVSKRKHAQWCLRCIFYKLTCSQTCIKRSFLGQKKWSYKTGDLLIEVQFIWYFLWQDKKNVTF